MFKLADKKIFYSKTCVKWPLSKRPKNGFQDRLSLNAGQKYRRMLQSVKQLPDTQVNFLQLEFTLVLLNPELTHVLLNLFLKTLDPDQLVSFRSHLRIYTVFHTIENTDLI